MNFGRPAVTVRATRNTLGEDLYRVVCNYASLGHHRSGTVNAVSLRTCRL